MSRPIASRSGSRGFALIAALFLLVVVAALGTFAVRVHMSQQSDADPVIRLQDATFGSTSPSFAHHCFPAMLVQSGCWTK